MNVHRDIYDDRIAPFIGNRNAKVFTGIRRSGKSTLMDMTADSILAREPDANIVRVNYELMSDRRLRSMEALYEHVKNSLADGKANYLFIDEIQEVQEWESVIRSLIAERCCDIYVSGSNSSLLSSEYATYLSGRLNTVPVQTLTLRECIRFREAYGGNVEAKAVLDDCIRQGGFPDLWTRELPEASARSSLQDIYSAVVLKDVVRRHEIRSTGALDRIMLFLCDNIGRFTSPHRIFTKLRSEGDDVNKDTVYSYLEHLEEAYVIRKAMRYDLKGRKLLESEYKYYLTDLGLKLALTGFRRSDVPWHIENMVFNELTARGYQVTVGRINGREIDFVASRGERRMYVQVAYMLPSEDVIEREFGNLREIQDGHPKYVVGMDPVWRSGDALEGIAYRELSEFLLADDW